MSTEDRVAVVFTEAIRTRLRNGLAQIEHCLGQLPDDDLYWRPFEGHNSICNIILHLCGSLRQWIIAGAGGAQDTRDRPAEFADRTRVPRETLVQSLRDTLAECDGVLARLSPDDLVSPRRIQGFATTALAAVLDNTAHVSGHVQEITYVTRMRLGDGYAFRWVPATKEQGAPA